MDLKKLYEKKDNIARSTLSIAMLMVVMIHIA